MMRESSHVGGLGVMMESDTAHGPNALVFLSDGSWNFRHHNRPVDIKHIVWISHPKA